MIATVTAASACGPTKRGPPSAPALKPATYEVAVGQKLFRKFCYQCHPNGQGGVGPALNDKPLPEVAIRAQIRNGVGAMPAFDESWMSDDEVAAVAEYVETLRQAPAERARPPAPPASETRLEAQR